MPSAERLSTVTPEDIAEVKRIKQVLKDNEQKVEDFFPWVIAFAQKYTTVAIEALGKELDKK